ncbi:MAG: ABC transporter ATP-binding protein [Tepidanaerobacteraceae bacterium]
MYIIEGHDLQIKTRDRTILQVKRVKLEQGRVFAVIGPNGSGKSTLLRVLALLQNPQRGTIYFKGKPVDKKAKIPVRRKMAVVFQEPLLLDATVRQNIMVGLNLRGKDKITAKKKADFWLDRLKVSHLSSNWARTLSGGEAQRVSLARAFALEPEVLFLDEPFSNLDTPTREDLLVELSEILHNTGVTTFFVSHNFEEVLFLASHAMALLDGLPIQEGHPRELMNNPKSTELARIMGVPEYKKKIFKTI